MTMALYVGPTFKCPGIVADRMGLRENQKVAHMTADTSGQMMAAAADMGLPDNRELGSGTVRWRYVVTAVERNRLLTHMGAREMTPIEMGRLELARADARDEARRRYR